MSWEDDKDLGPDPWNFTEQPNKWGYLNNPRWTKVPSAVSFSSEVGIPAGPTDKHDPCGHWHKYPATIKETFLDAMWQQSVDIIGSGSYVAFGAMSESSEDKYILVSSDYREQNIEYGKVFDLPNGHAWGYPGTTLVRSIGGLDTIFYTNFVEDQADFAYDIWFYRLNENGDYYEVKVFDSDWFTIYAEGDLYFVKDMAISGSNIVIVFTAYEDAIGDYNIYAAVSHNYGNSWSIVTIDAIQYGNDLSVDVTSGGDFYVITRDYIGNKLFRMFKSTDSGDSWSEVLTVPATVTASEYDLSLDITGNRIYVAGTATIVGVWKSPIHYSDDGGATWTTNYIATIADDYFDHLQLASNGDVIVCACYARHTTKVYQHIRSADAGATWTVLGQVYPVLTWPTFIPYAFQYFNIANNGSRFVYTLCGAYYLGTTNLAYMISVDNGLTWEVKQVPISNTVGVPTEVVVGTANEPQIWKNLGE